MSIIAQYGDIIVILACVFGFFMAWGVGANDVANAMGTSVGSKALTMKQAIMIAILFEFAGAYLAGGAVTATIRKGIIDPGILSGNPELLVFGMLSALLAAGLWLLIATHYGWPVSTTHSIVGAIVGFAAVGISVDAVHWDKVSKIVASWVVSPVTAGIIAFFLFRSVQKLILDTDKPFENSKKYVPVYIFLVGFIISMVTFTKGLKHIGLDISFANSAFISIGVAAITMFIGIMMLKKIKADPTADKDYHFASVEKVFGVLMMFTACAMAFAHGSNDVANAVGPLAAVVGVISSGGEVAQKTAMPAWILLLGGAGIVAGLIMYGHKVIATVGNNITELTPSRGFAATLAAATTVVVASGTGLPISTTHTLVGAVLGVGLARGLAALNLRVVGTIFVSWVVTLPAGALLAIMFFFMFKGMFT
ncbi:anion permease [Neptunomonas phycophila]|jgi:PiT family inorganic phosphate transporter|uniref:Phosphate transporter n=1 Tax=Neptunomonas phycophila TaxID=1572645 RepID=A0AAW7XJF9_9GAMM|nr:MULTISPECIES: inorganic phosphate transporter [Neptunomonas]MBT3144662.1 inorganic phosphate transporter [Neptunomonas phycophila]MDN2660807.1 inorganic phosphate transporter [Neptunomonas sp. CHC150]MDO6453747.1 anion permease [Neptunomonas phycophila]MDO6467942.1 anion permease [Neptunomonas phycophila]MDO6783987.1 anion permease [Neptunomonas phycophila]